MTILKYWLWLTTRRGLSTPGVLSVLDHFGTPEGAYFADPGEYALIPGLTPFGQKSLMDKALDEPERILAECERLGIRIMTIHDAGYPERLKNIYDPPVVLYLKGKELSFDDQVAIAVIGSRRPSEYGVVHAERLGRELARQGAVVVSGMAMGLDSQGIRGALRGGGTVVGVLGCGLDVVYPRENRFLFQDVEASGVLLSEYPPGTPPRSGNFPARNRIISGLSLGVVVVEGEAQSGTKITVAAALDQNRDVFALPGGVDAPLSVTPNELIRRSEAKLITSASDILEEYQSIYPHKIRLMPALAPQEPPEAEAVSQAAKEEKKPQKQEKVVDKEEEIPYIHWKKLTPALTDDQRDILLALRDKPMGHEEIIEATQIPARRATSAITMLQLAGFLAETAGRRFAATVRIGVE